MKDKDQKDKQQGTGATKATADNVTYTTQDDFILVSKEGEEPEHKAVVYHVAEPFKDIHDFNLTHEKGKDVSHFDAERLKFLVEQGYVNKK